jgi:endonuclease/exonuclease/phosphatase family metal-dependent hydrolase
MNLIMARVGTVGLLVGLMAPMAWAEEPGVLRVMTYNIHHGVGIDGKLDLERIAALIKQERADIVALQEVDRNVPRSGKQDIAARLGELTDMRHVFGKNIDLDGGEYGNAILSRFPISEHRHTRYRISVAGEQRGLLEATITVSASRELLVLCTHLDFKKEDEERLANVAEAMSRLAARQRKLPVILCGDFNAPPGSPAYKAVLEHLADCWQLAGEGHGFTIPVQFPAARIDYLFIDKQSPLKPHKAWVPRSTASDHLPVVVEFELRAYPEPSADRGTGTICSQSLAN